MLLDRFTRMTWDVIMCKRPHPEDQFLSPGRQHLLLEITWFWHISGIGLSGHKCHSLIFQQEKGERVFPVTIYICLNICIYAQKHRHTYILLYV